MVFDRAGELHLNVRGLKQPANNSVFEDSITLSTYNVTNLKYVFFIC